MELKERKKRLGDEAAFLLLLDRKRTLLELAAGRVDIGSAGIANGGLNAMHLKTALKAFDLLEGRGFEDATRRVIELDEIHMAKRSSAEVNESFHLGVRVVHAVNHRVFISGASTGFLGIRL